MKILTIGGATQDIFILYEDAETLHLHTKLGVQSFLLLKEGGKIEVKNILYSTGGGANNTAFSFKKLGFDVDTIVKISDDEQGKFILKKLKDAGISTNHVIVDPGKQTGMSFIIPSLEHDRTIFAFRGINATMRPDEIPFDLIKEYDYLYITSLSGSSSEVLLPIVQEAKRHNIPVAINPGTSQLVKGAAILRESLSNIDILISNSSEAKKFMLSLVETTHGLRDTLSSQTQHTQDTHVPALLEEPISIEDIRFSLNNYFKAVFSNGPKIVVITNGAEGVYVGTKDTIYYHPGLKIKAVNTLGAGDAFGSSFIGTLAAGKSIEQAIRHGIINSASVIGYMDTKQGLLSMKDLEEKVKKLDPTLLQKFVLQ